MPLSWCWARKPLRFRTITVTLAQLVVAVVVVVILATDLVEGQHPCPTSDQLLLSNTSIWWRNCSAPSGSITVTLGHDGDIEVQNITVRLEGGTFLPTFSFAVLSVAQEVHLTVRNVRAMSMTTRCRGVFVNTGRLELRNVSLSMFDTQMMINCSSTASDSGSLLSLFLTSATQLDVVLRSVDISFVSFRQLMLVNAAQSLSNTTLSLINVTASVVIWAQEVHAVTIQSPTLSNVSVDVSYCHLDVLLICYPSLTAAPMNPPPPNASIDRSIDDVGSKRNGFLHFQLDGSSPPTTGTLVSDGVCVSFVNTTLSVSTGLRAQDIDSTEVLVVRFRGEDRKNSASTAIQRLSVTVSGCKLNVNGTILASVFQLDSVGMAANTTILIDGGTIFTGTGNGVLRAPSRIVCLVHLHGSVCTLAQSTVTVRNVVVVGRVELGNNLQAQGSSAYGLDMVVVGLLVRGVQITIDDTTALATFGNGSLAPLKLIVSGMPPMVLGVISSFTATGVRSDKLNVSTDFSITMRRFQLTNNLVASIPSVAVPPALQAVFPTFGMLLVTTCMVAPLANCTHCSVVIEDSVVTVERSEIRGESIGTFFQMPSYVKFNVTALVSASDFSALLANISSTGLLQNARGSVASDFSKPTVFANVTLVARNSNVTIVVRNAANLPQECDELTLFGSPRFLWHSSVHFSGCHATMATYATAPIEVPNGTAARTIWADPIIPVSAILGVIGGNWVNCDIRLVRCSNISSVAVAFFGSMTMFQVTVSVTDTQLVSPWYLPLTALVPEHRATDVVETTSFSFHRALLTMSPDTVWMFEGVSFVGFRSLFSSKASYQMSTTVLTNLTPRVQIVDCCFGNYSIGAAQVGLVGAPSTIVALTRTNGSLCSPAPTPPTPPPSPTPSPPSAPLPPAQATSASLAAATGAISAVGILAGGAAELSTDMQLLAAIGFSACAPSEIRGSTSAARFLLSPFYSLGLVAMTLGNAFLALTIAALHYVVVRLLERKRRRTVDDESVVAPRTQKPGILTKNSARDAPQKPTTSPPTKQPAHKLGFPSRSVAAAQFLLIGVTSASTSLVLTAATAASIAVGVLGWIFVAACFLGRRWLVARCVHVRRMFFRLYRPRTLRESVVPMFLLPVGRWGPDASRAMYGTLLGAVRAQREAYASSKLIYSTAMAAALAVPVSPSHCTTLWVIAAVPPLVFSAVTIAARPSRVPVSDALSVAQACAKVTLLICAAVAASSSSSNVLAVVAPGVSAFASIVAVTRLIHQFFVSRWEENVNAVTSEKPHGVGNNSLQPLGPAILRPTDNRNGDGVDDVDLLFAWSPCRQVPIPPSPRKRSDSAANNLNDALRRLVAAGGRREPLSPRNALHVLLQHICQMRAAKVNKGSATVELCQRR